MKLLYLLLGLFNLYLVLDSVRKNAQFKAKWAKIGMVQPMKWKILMGISQLMSALVAAWMFALVFV